MVKITPIAIEQILNEVQDTIKQGVEPFIRLTMGIG